VLSRFSLACNRRILHSGAVGDDRHDRGGGADEGKHGVGVARSRLCLVEAGERADGEEHAHDGALFEHTRPVMSYRRGTQQYNEHEARGAK